MQEPPTKSFPPTEAIIWSLALVVLAVLPAGTGDHFTICVPHLLGMDGCMGCGLGTSIGLFLRGDIGASFHAHILGPLAVVILVARILTLTIRSKQTKMR